ncbi:MAG: carbohydrate ABC transporter permease [Fimbriimonas sp.]|nr:carbohydrate ABC transporter permease [Fimbriimonas sp.]
MTSNLLYAIGVLAAWSGAAMLLRALYLTLRRAPGVAISAGAGGLLLLGASTTPVYAQGLGIPILWIVAPFAAWATATCGWMAAVRLFQAILDGIRSRLYAGLIWIAAGAVFVALYRLDPESKIEIVRGQIGLSLVSGSSLVGLAVAAIAAMAAASRRVRQVSGRLAVHAALLAGSIVFGLPFAWLLVTSFKEDRDMSNANGLIWVPRVQRTVPFLDPSDPLLEGEYKGNWVQASLSGRTSNGSYIVEVQRPASLRGVSFVGAPKSFRVVPKDAPVVSGAGFIGFVTKELDDGRRVVRFSAPLSKAGKEQTFMPADLQPVRDIALRTQNYTDALEAMPIETKHGLVYLKNTLILVVLSVIGTLLSSSIVAYAFARLRFPGRDTLFKILLATMMLPGAVTLMPQFLLYRSLGWIDTLLPLWVPAFFAGAFNVFLLRQFFSQIPTELEDAGKIDGAGVLQTFWRIMLPQIKPALAVVAIWTFMGAWNNFMGPLLYINTPENMPLSYALQLFQSERGGEPGLMMAFATLTILPVLALFFFAQRYFIEGVTLSGFGGR